MGSVLGRPFYQKVQLSIVSFYFTNNGLAQLSCGFVFFQSVVITGIVRFPQICTRVKRISWKSCDKSRSFSYLIYVASQELPIYKKCLSQPIECRNYENNPHSANCFLSKRKQTTNFIHPLSSTSTRPFAVFLTIGQGYSARHLPRSVSISSLVSALAHEHRGRDICTECFSMVF